MNIISKYLSFILIAFISFTIHSYSQWNVDCQVYSNQYTYKNHKIDFNRNLSSSNVTDFEFDGDGNIWFALKEDLRINKNGFPEKYQSFFSRMGVNLTNEAYASLRSINCLKRDEAGNMWIGTESGLLCFDGTVLHEIKNSSNFPFKRIKEIAVDPNGNIWVCGVEVLEKFMKIELIKENSGIAMFDGEKWKSYTGGNSDIPCCKMRHLTFAKDGTLWMLGDHKTGICSFKDSKWSVYNKENSSLPTNDFTTIVNDFFNNRILFAWKGGVISYTDSQWKEASDFFGIKDINCILMEDKDVSWVGTKGRGVLICNKNARKKLYSDTSPLMTNSVEKIIAKDGYKWLLQPHYSYSDDVESFGGVCGIKLELKEIPENWEFFNAYNSVFEFGSPVSVSSIKKESIVIVTKKKIQQYSKDFHKDFINNTDKDRYFASAVSETGEYYFVTKNRGLCKLIDGQLTVIIPSNKDIFNNDISKMIIDKNQNIWISSLKKGVIKCSDQKTVIFDKKKSKLPHNKVYTIFIDSKDRLWAGTGKGVFLMQGSSFKTFNKKNSELQGNKVFAIGEDKNGDIFIGNKKGLAVFTNDGISRFNRIQKDEIHQIESDKNGDLWIGTSYSGLFKWDGQECVSFLNNSILLSRKVEYITATPKRDKIWIIASIPSKKLPVFSSQSKLEKAQDDLKGYDKDNLSDDDKKAISKLKFKIKILTKQAKYEEKLIVDLGYLFPYYAFIAVDIE